MESTLCGGLRAHARLLLFAAAVFAGSFLFFSHANAATYYWVGSDGRWETAANWSTVEKGGTGGSHAVPGASDTAVLSFSGAALRLRTAASLTKLIIAPTWSGSLTMGSGTLAVSSHVRVGSGRILGGTGSVNIGGSYTQTGGIITFPGGRTGGNLTLSGSLSITKGATSAYSNFTSTGTIIFDGATDQTITTGSTATVKFQRFTINNTGDTDADDIIIATSGDLALSGTLLVTLGNMDLATNSKAMRVESGVTLANAAQATLTTNSNITASGSIKVNDAATWTMSAGSLTLNGHTQNLNLDGQSIPNLVIASSVSTTLTDNLTVSTSLQISAGSILALSTFTLTATDTTFTNLATLTEGAGMLYHAASDVLITDSTYAAVNTTVLGDSAYFTLTDADENIDGTVADTVTVTVSGGGDSETVTLTETSVTSGLFRGSIVTAAATAAAGDGTLQSPGATVIYLQYTDAQDLLSYSDTSTLSEAATTASTESTAGQGSRRGSGGGGGGGSLPASSAASSASSTATVQETALPNVRGLLQVMVEGKALVFKDIPVQAWFAKFVSTVVGKAIASGYKDAKGNLTGEYGPGNPVTYAEIAKMALEAAKKNPGSVSGAPKNSSAAGQWSERYIKLAEDLNLSVYGPSLDVNLPATRGAVLQTVLESLGLQLDEAQANVYSDLPISHPHVRALATATRLGIINGDTDAAGIPKGTVRPNANINRAEVAKIMAKVVEMSL
ncbi:MAG: S-layer homology domain-containing protein [Candidatus Peribacteraceae bacterium]|jgi:hypothetical protein